MTTASTSALAEPRIVWSTDGDTFCFDSLGELLQYHTHLQAGAVVHFGTADQPEVNQLIDADDVIDQLNDRACDLAGEFADDYPNVSKDAKAELNALLAAWVTKHCEPNFWTVSGVKEYTLTADDVPPATEAA